MKVVKSLENRLPQIMGALEDVARSGSYAEGKYLNKVTSQVQTTLGVPPVMTNSCGSALYLVFKYLKEFQGVHDALVQNNTFYASGACALEAGIKVHLVDSRADCPSMSLQSLKEAYRLTGIKIVVLTHVAGWLAKDYAEISVFCDDNGLTLVEDCAHAFGVPSAGVLGAYSCWSFYPTKAVPCGEGGAVTSYNHDFMVWASRYIQYGKYKVDGVLKYGRGMNLRMSEWDAAVLSVQLEHLEEILTLRAADANALQSIAPCMLSGMSNYYKFPVRTADAQGLKRVGKVYQKSDQLLHSLRVYAEMGLVGTPVPLTNSDIWADSHECLPCGEGLYLGMSSDEVRELLKETHAS